VSDRHPNKEFDERLKRYASDYNEPPEAPRELMWARIQQARAAHDKAIEPVRTPRWWAWSRRFALPAAAAAMVVIAFAIGRFSAPKTGVETTGTQVESGTVTRTSDQKTRHIYQMAAAPVLGRAEVLLTQFRATDPLNGDGLNYAERASALLVDTRYLMNTPAADDPALRQLLADLELALAQIVRASAQEGHERQWADESIDDRLLLQRLRTKSNVGTSI
jgi:hypothetical protein